MAAMQILRAIPSGERSPNCAQVGGLPKNEVDGYPALTIMTTAQTRISIMSVPPHTFRNPGRSFWTHSSVVAFAANRDPVQRMISSASSLTLDAMQAGWSGPPYDPFQLAQHLKVRAIPSENISDAQITQAADGRFQIEFNPNRPRGRVRYSVAHELAHTIFPDCGEVVRHRLARQEQKGDEWQLEMLCNIGAAEFLMPVGSFDALKKQVTDIDQLLRLRSEFDVSMEALLLRVIRLTEQPCAMFTASRREDGATKGRYQLDYTVSSRSWPVKLTSGTPLPKTKSLPEITAIGFTAKADEGWPEPAGQVHVECVGIAPYPSRSYPRVVGMVRPLAAPTATTAGIEFIKGDATQPRGEGRRILAHVVNDKTALWGAGFGLAVRKKWPQVQTTFQNWAAAERDNLRLGKVFMSAVDQQTTAFQMICQHGYGPSPKPRIRYSALRSCLEQLAQFAVEQRASVHMPRIGSGYAGGAWGLIGQLIDETLCARGLRVTVYDLPESPGQFNPKQSSLFDRRA
ncbi:MAG: ImmA/IrrE family metallo-endopeptidase [Verrucomicrobiae bacterium]|nr:ImmA/IrrE family metallo-endopeptidase [Verrucomicrobiae bacterium]